MILPAYGRVAECVRHVAHGLADPAVFGHVIKKVQDDGRSFSGLPADVVSIVSCASKFFPLFWPIMKHLPILSSSHGAALLAGCGGQKSETPPPATTTAPVAPQRPPAPVWAPTDSQTRKRHPPPRPDNNAAAETTRSAVIKDDRGGHGNRVLDRRRAQGQSRISKSWPNPAFTMETAFHRVIKRVS